MNLNEHEEHLFLDESNLKRKRFNTHSPSTFQLNFKLADDNRSKRNAKIWYEACNCFESERHFFVGFPNEAD